MQRGGAPGGHRQPLALVNRRIAQMLPHQGRIVQIMVFKNELIASADFIRTAQQTDLQMIQHMLFLSGKTFSFGS